MEASGSRRSTVARVVVAVCSLLIVLGAGRIGLEHALDRRAGRTPAVAGGAPTPPVSSGQESPATAVATGDPGSPQGVVQACVRKQEAGTAVVLAARRAASDWRQHVQGQTALEAGEMTLTEVKDQLWGPTRKAGPTDVAAYVRAADDYATLPACRVPSGSASAALTACVARQTALDAVLSAAAPVVDDWRGHLDAMARHSVGLVTGAEAQEDWIRRWTAAGPHLLALTTAESALANAPACPA